jgi:hypothetical protein
MGWTGRSEYDFDNVADFADDYVKNDNIKKRVRKGNEFYYLIQASTGEDWILKILTRKNGGCYWRKEIQMNPYEAGTPLSILKEFIPSNDKDREWLENEMKLAQCEHDKKKIEVGDIYEVVAKWTLIFGYGKIEKGETFYVKVEEKKNLKRASKIFRVMKKGKTLDGRDAWGETNLRIKNNTFNAHDVKFIENTKQ